MVIEGLSSMQYKNRPELQALRFLLLDQLGFSSNKRPRKASLSTYPLNTMFTAGELGSITV